MKLRTPNVALIFMLAFSFVIFLYVNYCPSTQQNIDQIPTSVLTVSEDILHFPELELVVRACRSVVSFLFP